MEREEGWYWVKFHSASRWFAALYEEGNWSFCGSIYRSPNFHAIGPKIEPPE